jgi:uncharacterized membrane protein
MLRDSWWWPWWVSSLIDIGVVIGALVVLRLSKQRAVRALAAVLAVAGLVAAILAPIVMTDQPDRPMQNEPAMPGRTR